jgi:hypothetical protein
MQAFVPLLTDGCVELDQRVTSGPALRPGADA